MFCTVFPGQPPTMTLETEDKVWAPGYDVFLRATEGKPLWEKDPLVNMESFKPVLNAQMEFWLKLMDMLPSEILQECQLGSPNVRLPDLLRLYHSGIVFVLLHMPSNLYTFNADIYKTLRDALESPEFWEYNPIHLVSTLLWAVSLHDKAEEVLETSMPLSAESLAELLPLLDAPDIQESDVFCQEVALDFVTNALQTGHDAQPLLNFLLSSLVLPQPMLPFDVSFQQHLQQRLANDPRS